MTDHSITWDHSGCEHEDDWCRPEATFTCQASADALCVNSCHECDDYWSLCSGGEECGTLRAEQDEYKDEEDQAAPTHPAERHCTFGHLITPNWKNECYAILSLHYGGGPVSWFEAAEQYEGTKLMRVKDGPVVVVPQGAEGCTWYYEGDRAYA